MKSDFTRLTFNPKKHYSSVLMQQGRVQLDSDWNEQLAITHHRIKTETRDVIGDCGGPAGHAGFELTPSGKDLLISAGRYYVNGILCENEEPVKLSEQPDIPAENNNNLLVILSNSKPALFPPPKGNYLAYLDVWYRHITFLEDPEVRETALGGPDTATRSKTVWQVKLLQLDNPDVNCLSDIKAWDDLTAKPDGKLSARAEEDELLTDPCIIAPGAGYRRLENQLYRVEVHQSGQRGNATFKWSRDNGSIAVKWLSQDGDNLTVSSLGRDKYLGFNSGQWIELFDDSNDLFHTPGKLVRIIKAANNIITIDPSGQTININDFPDNPRVRRWDSNADMLIETPSQNNGWLKIEDGVEVKFSAGFYRSGDYWVIPARTSKANVEWPEDNTGNPAQELPKGIKHNYCRLAIAEFDGEAWNILSDCRNIFPPLTEIEPGKKDKGIHVQKIILISSEDDIINDTEINVNAFSRGIGIFCDESVEQDTIFNRPTCFVTIDLPFPLVGDDREFWSAGEIIGFQPLRLNAATSSKENLIMWEPAAHVREWLRKVLFARLLKFKVERVLTHLTLMGNFIWSANDRRKYLDGEVFGIRKEASAGPTMIDFPSGNGIKGGDLEMWFYLVPDLVELGTLHITEINFISNVSGIEHESSAGKIVPPVEPNKVNFKAAEIINIIEINFSRPIRREGLGNIGTPQSIRLDLIDDNGNANKMFGDIQIVNEQKVRFFMRDPGAINSPGRFRLVVLGDDRADGPAVKAQDDNSALDGDYDDQPGKDFELLFLAL